eukprot:1092237-Pelagomonas_calceolata.AAC.1
MAISATPTRPRYALWQSKQHHKAPACSHNAYKHSVPSRANQTFPNSQQTLPFLTLKDKALESLTLLILGDKN